MYRSDRPKPRQRAAKRCDAAMTSCPLPEFEQARRRSRSPASVRTIRRQGLIPTSEPGGHWQLYDTSVLSELEIRNRIRRSGCANFGFIKGHWADQVLVCPHGLPGGHGMLDRAVGAPSLFHFVMIKPTHYDDDAYP